MALNVEQKRAVLCDDNLLILAPPGSGKTGTLVAKAGHLLQSNPNSRVILVTFTDASAREAHHRLAKKLQPDQMRRASVSTFHKHAISQLRSAGKLGRILSPYEF